MRPSKIIIQFVLSSLLLLVSASCDKSEKKEIQEEAAKKSKGGNQRLESKEKADNARYPLMWVESMKKCISTPCMCTKPIVVTPSMAVAKRDLDQAIDAGNVQSLSASVFHTLFPDLPDQEVQGILNGRTELCKLHQEAEQKTFYFGYEKGFSCEKARTDKDARKWVLQTEKEG